jgi:hypothetical protein
MANPCCSKCSGTHFAKHLNTAVSATLIYWTKCGFVLGAIPARTTQASNSSGSAERPVVGSWNQTTNRAG